MDRVWDEVRARGTAKGAFATGAAAALPVGGLPFGASLFGRPALATVVCEGAAKTGDGATLLYARAASIAPGAMRAVETRFFSAWLSAWPSGAVEAISPSATSAKLASPPPSVGRAGAFNTPLLAWV